MRKLKPFKSLFLSLFLLNFLDIITTWTGLTLKPDVTELNHIYYVWPFSTICLMKVATIALMAIFYRLTYGYMRKNKAVKMSLKIILICLDITYLCVVVNNLVILLFA